MLPRDLCFLPLEVLLVSNNRLVSLPEELGRMENLTELDASCNQITHLPARMSDLKNLRSLSLRNNQLVYLPRELTCLQLVFLDVSCNRISALPIELRLMKSLVDLELSNNPLTSPPASVSISLPKNIIVIRMINKLLIGSSYIVVMCSWNGTRFQIS